MATLGAVLRLATRRLALRVSVSGVVFVASEVDTPGLTSVHVSKSYDAPVPIATVGLTSMPTWVAQGLPVLIEKGYDNLMKPVFTGHVRSVAKGTATAELECVGRSANLGRVNDLSERNVTGMNVKTAIESILHYCNVFNYNTSLVPTTFTLGTVAAAILPRGSAMSMLQALMDIEGLAMYESGDGIIYFMPFSGLPAPKAFKNFTTNTLASAFIIDGRIREDPDYLRTRIILTGATITTGAPPNDVTSTITSTATLINPNIVQPPLPAGSYIDMEFSNSLLDTQAKADAVALRELTKYARVPQQLPLDIPGDPEIDMGQTLYVKDELIDVDDRWFVYGVTHNITLEDGFRTEVDLRGGNRFGGSIGVNPIASFFVDVEREIFGTKEYIFLHLDARASFDPDGGDYTTLTFAWSGNQDAADSPNIDAQTSATPPVIRLDPALISGDVIITLIVTDPDALPGTTQLTVDINVGASGVLLPAVFAALNNNFSATPDGGQNWYDQIANATNVTTVAAMPPDGVHAGVAVFGRTDGKIYRTADYCATALTLVLTATDQIVDIAWDIFNSQRVWALTANCNLYVSSNMGVIWSLIANWRTAMSLSTIIGKRVAVENDGAVWVYGGTGVVSNGRPFIGRYDGLSAPFGFASVFGGELLSDLGAGATALAIVDAANKHDGGGLTIIMENYNASDSGVRPIYHCVNPFVPIGWQRATGLTAGLTTAGRYVLPTTQVASFVAAFANRDVWRSSNGVAWTQTANVLEVGFTPNRAIWLREDGEGNPGLVGVYMVAAEDSGGTGRIYKSFDELQTVGVFRHVTGFGPGWPASAKAKDLAVGPFGTIGTDQLLVIQSGTGPFPAIYKRVTAKLAGNTWSALENGSSVLQNRMERLKKLGANYYRNVISDSNSDQYIATAVGQLQRSTNGGLTWSNVGPAPHTIGGGRWWGVEDYDIGPSGVLWLCAGPDGLSTITPGDEPVIYKSVNDGVTWSAVFTESTTSSGSFESMNSIACHPVNANIIHVEGVDIVQNNRSWTTLNGGASFTRRTTAAGAGGESNSGRQVFMWDNGRILHAVGGLGVIRDRVWYSDDYGVTWVQTTVESVMDNGYYLWQMLRGNAQGLAFIIGGSATVPQVVRTRNYGLTWENIIDGEAIFTGGTMAALAYDQVNDILYAASEAGSDPVGPRVRLSALNSASIVPASAAGSQPVRSAQYNLDTICDIRIAHLGMVV